MSFSLRENWIYYIMAASIFVIAALLFMAMEKSKEDAAFNESVREKIRNNDIKSVTIFGHTAYCIKDKPYVKTKDDRFYPVSIANKHNPCLEEQEK